MWRRSRRLYLTEQAAGGGVGLLVRMPAYLTAAFLMLFSLGQRCTVNTNEREPCLLTSPLQAEGERQIKTVCLNAYPPLETVLAAEKHIVCIGIDYVNSINSVWFILFFFLLFFWIEFKATFCICSVTRRTWFSVQTQTHYRSAPRTWTAPWVKPPGPSRRPPKRYSRNPPPDPTPILSVESWHALLRIFTFYKPIFENCLRISCLKKKEKSWGQHSGALFWCLMQQNRLGESRPPPLLSGVIDSSADRAVSRHAGETRWPEVPTLSRYECHHLARALVQAHRKL